MKKIISMLMAMGLMVGGLGVSAVPAFAEEETKNEPAAGTVLRVSAQEKGGWNNEVIKDYTNFEEGWEAAIDFALNESGMKNYSRVVVDFYADWKANDKGEFGDTWDGFSHYTIEIPDDVRITLNLNGHTINRGLEKSEADGEVIYIDEDADVIINNGTITGGFSNNGAGGIHIHDADVILNDVHVDGNKVRNDDGAGIALYDNATLIMNGGSISNNVSKGGETQEPVYGGGIYVDSSAVDLNDVVLKNNQCESNYKDKMFGSAIYSTDSRVKLTNCTVESNGVTKDDASFFCASTVYAEDSSMVIKDTSFIGNGAKNGWHNEHYSNYKGSTVMSLQDSDLTMTGGRFTNNRQVFLLSLWDSTVSADGVDFTGNDSFAIQVGDASSAASTFANCKFSAGFSFGEFKYDFEFGDEDRANLIFSECDFGKATFSSKNAVKFIGGTVSNNVGSIFGKGSFAMIIALSALIASGISIFLNVANNKKKAISASASEAETDENK